MGSEIKCLKATLKRNIPPDTSEPQFTCARAIIIYISYALVHVKFLFATKD